MRACLSPLFAGLLSVVCHSAVAESIAYPVITVQCDEQNDVLKIKNEVKWNEEGKQFPFSAVQGTYNPWDWVRIDATRTVEPSGQLELACQLNNNLYKLVLRPRIFNQNYDGKCGNRLSADVTVFRGGAVVIENQPLEEYCFGNAPVIRGIKVMGKSGEVKYLKVPKHKFL